MPSNYNDIYSWNLIKIKNKIVETSVNYKLVVSLPVTPVTVKISALIKSIISDGTTVLFTDKEDNTYKCLIRKYDENITASQELIAVSNINNPNFIFSILPEDTDFELLKVQTTLNMIKVTKI